MGINVCLAGHFSRDLFSGLHRCSSISRSCFYQFQYRRWLELVQNRTCRSYRTGRGASHIGKPDNLISGVGIITARAMNVPGLGVALILDRCVVVLSTLNAVPAS